MWPHEYEMSRVLFLDVGCAVIDAAVEQVYVSEKVVNERAGRAVVDLIRRSDLLDAAFVHHRHPVRDLQRFFLIVSHEYARDVHFVVQSAQPRRSSLRTFASSAPNGSSSNKHARFHRQRTRRGNALALASGKLRGIAVGLPVLQLNELQQARERGSESRCGRANCCADARAGRTRRSRRPSCAGRARSAERRSRHAARARCDC